MRVTNSMIYDSVIQYTNAALERYYALAEQNSSLRKLNTPSDDPNGVGQVLGLRDSLRSLTQYQENIDTATGWLTAADSALQEASDLITNIIELAEQGATETLNADERLLVAQNVREDFEQLLGLANSEYSDQSIFAGLSIDDDAYEMVLSADLYGDTLSDAALVSVSGDSDSSVLVRFTTGGTVGVDEISYQYSTDGGDTWTDGVLASGAATFSLDSCSVTLASNTTITATDDDGGDYMVVRPAALYLGNANDGAKVTHYGSGAVDGEASGTFSSTVLVRIDTASGASGTSTYSYSTDNGATWVTGNTSDGWSFAVPGGALELAATASNSALSTGEQFIITPYDADLDLAISTTGSVTVNSVGKDIFGGLYQAPGEDTATAVDGDNLFESVGRLIGALETNDTDVIGECLEEIRNALATVEKAAATIGAREARLEYATSAITAQSDTQDSAASSIEDADLTTLMVQLEAAETIYKSVVETSTNILTLSLVNYL